MFLSLYSPQNSTFSVVGLSIFRSINQINWCINLWAFIGSLLSFENEFEVKLCKASEAIIDLLYMHCMIIAERFIPILLGSSGNFLDFYEMIIRE